MSRSFLHVEVEAGPGRGTWAQDGGPGDLALKGLLSEFTDRIETLGAGRITAEIPRVRGMERVARELEQRIRDTLSLSPRMGLAPNVPLARLASRAARPSGLLVVEDASDRRLGRLPVDALHGVGPVSAKMLETAGVSTVADLLTISERRIGEILGSVQGARVFRAVHGRDPGVPRRSRSAERTFPEAVRDPRLLLREIERQLSGLLLDTQREAVAPRTLSVRVRLRSGEVASRSRTLADPCRDRGVLLELASTLLHDRTGVGRVEVRTIGIVLTGFGPLAPQLLLPFE